MAFGGGPGGPGGHGGPGGPGHGPGHGPGFGLGFGHFAGGNPHVGVPRGTSGHDSGNEPGLSEFPITHNFLPSPRAQRIVRTYAILAVIMAFTMTIGNILGAKVWSIGIVILDGGILLTPFGMAAQDICNEVFYKKETDRINTWVALLNIIAALALLLCAHVLPSNPDTVNPDFVATFGFSTRIFIASSIAYWVRGRINNRVYQQMRETTDENDDIDLRSIVSSFCGRLFDTTIFTFLAFFGRGGFITTVQQAIGSFIVATIIEAILSKIIVVPVSRWLIKNLKT